MVAHCEATLDHMVIGRFVTLDHDVIPAWDAEIVFSIEQFRIVVKSRRGENHLSRSTNGWVSIQTSDSTIVFLPSAHIAQRVVNEIVTLRMGAPVWFSESLAKLPSELKNIRPTFFLAPPRVDPIRI